MVTAAIATLGRSWILAVLYICLRSAVALADPIADTTAEIPPVRRSLVVDDILSVESFGRVLFTSDGQVIGEYQRPYGTRPIHSSVDRVASQIVTLNRSARPLFTHREHTGYMLVSASPDGRRLAIRATTLEGIHVAIADTQRGTIVTLRHTPYADFEDDGVTWLSSETLVYSTTTALPILIAGIEGIVASELQQGWRVARRGSQSTARVLRSRAQDAGSQTFAGHLIVASARTGRGEIIAPGLFMHVQPSPSRSFIAGMRRRALRETAPSSFEYLQVASDFRLVRVNGPRRGQVISPCDDCEVLHQSVVWDAQQDIVYFFARSVGSEWRHGSFYRYSVESMRAERLDLGGRRWLGWEYFGGVVRGQEKPYPPVPLSGGLAVLLESNSATGASEWTLIAPGVPSVALSGSMIAMDPTPVGTSRECIVSIAANDVWRHCVGQEPFNLTRQIGRVVGVTRSPEIEHGISPSPARVPHGENQPLGHLLIQVEDGESVQVVRLDMDSGLASSFSTLRSGEDVVAISRDSAMAVTRHSTPAGVEISLLDGVSGRRTLAELNRFFRDIDWPNARPLAYELNGAELNGCAYFGAGVSDQTPIIVWVYPGLVTPRCRDGQPPPGLQMGQPDLYSPEYLASLGYVVIVPAMPLEILNSTSSAGAEAANLIEAAINAADAAGRLGLGDPDRVGLYGFSQGGTTALQALAQSNRFATAAIGFSATNFTSDYADFSTAGHLLPNFWAPGKHDWYPNNALQARTTPWSDPEWFVRSSPYFSAEHMTAPVFLFNSDMDAGFPPSQFNQLFTALYLQRRNVDYVSYLGEGHGVYSPANIRDLDARLRGWFASELGEPLHIH